MTASELTMDGFSGAMLRPGDADYDQARRVRADVGYRDGQAGLVGE